MTKQESNRLDPIKNWIQEAGTDQLGADFHLAVLKKIEKLPKTSLSYEPVISALAWKLILIFISGIFGGTLIFHPSKPNDISLFDKLPPARFPNPSFLSYDFSFPIFDFSQQFLMGITTFFILGFIMIAGTLRNKQADL
jgi:hypothetical protein